MNRKNNGKARPLRLANLGVVLARVGAAEIRLTEENKMYVVFRGVSAFATCGAKGVIYYDRDGFAPPQDVTTEVARLLGVQRANRLKHWHRNSPDHYEKHELELVTEY